MGLVAGVDISILQDQLSLFGNCLLCSNSDLMLLQIHMLTLKYFTTVLKFKFKALFHSSANQKHSMLPALLASLAFAARFLKLPGVF